MLHGDDQQFLGKLQVGLVKLAQHRHRILDQIGYGVEQAGVLLHLAPDLFGNGFNLILDGLATLRRVNHHLVLFAFPEIGFEAVEFEFVRFQETMAPGSVAGLDALELEFQPFAVEQRGYPMDRTRERELARSPAHFFGKGDIGNPLRKVFI